MKSIISSSNLDFIIEEGTQLKYGTDGNRIPGGVDGTFKQKGSVKNISMFVMVNDPYKDNVQVFTRVYLTPDDVKMLHKSITEIEARESEGPDDELPW